LLSMVGARSSRAASRVLPTDKALAGWARLACSAAALAKAADGLESAQDDILARTVKARTRTTATRSTSSFQLFFFQWQVYMIGMGRKKI